MVYSKQFNERMKRIFMADLKNSTRITLPHWRRRPAQQRVFESLARLMSPIL